MNLFYQLFITFPLRPDPIYIIIIEKNPKLYSMVDPKIKIPSELKNRCIKSACKNIGVKKRYISPFYFINLGWLAPFLSNTSILTSKKEPALFTPCEQVYAKIMIFNIITIIVNEKNYNLGQNANTSISQKFYYRGSFDRSALPELIKIWKKIWITSSNN